MRKFSLWALFLLSLLTFSCKEEDDINGIDPLDCQVSDLEGSWIWRMDNDTPRPSEKIMESIFDADGKETLWYVKDGKWVKEEMTALINKGVLTHKENDEKFNIVVLNNQSLIVESLKDKTRYTADKVHSTDNKHLLGTWVCDTFKVENLTVFNYELSISDTGYVASYTGAEPISGQYWMNNNFMLYSSNRVGSMYVTTDMSPNGLILKQTYINIDGTMLHNTFYRKHTIQFTLDDVVGTWITTDKDGEPIPLEQASICVAADNSGSSIISKIENNTWVGKNVQLSVKNNVVKRIIEGSEDEYFNILYFDHVTIVWRNQMTGSVVTRKRIERPDEFKERILGFWHNEDVKLDDGVVSDFRFIVKEDSVICNFDNTVRNYAYKLYGNILAMYNNDSCLLLPFSLGYDKERKEAFMNHYLGTRENPNIITVYKLDLEQKLAGSWIFVKNGDGSPLKTVDCSIVRYDPMTHKNVETIFRNGYEEDVVCNYTIEKNIVKYDDPNYPYDEILKIEEQTLLIRDFRGGEYLAYRLNYPNPLAQAIVGEWYCESFNEETESISKFTHTFDNNGMVTFKHDGVVSSCATYRLYDRFLVIRSASSNNQINTIVWVIKGGTIGETMKWERILDGDKTIENVLTKK